jgi:L-ascorbate metabolism protein UlaG (beta-lactamase superfamily)
MDAEQGIKMIDTVNPKIAIPIHYNDYDFKSSLDDFKNKVKERRMEGRVRYLSHGDTYTFG